MTILQDDKCPDKTRKTGTVRMGRDVSVKKTSCCGSEKDTACADKKEKTRMNEASSLV
jgi:hypothetical protein